MPVFSMVLLVSAGSQVNARTCTSPVSSPATTSFPSPRMFPLLATSLNREIVLVTFCVLGAYICTRVAAVTA